MIDCYRYSDKEEKILRDSLTIIVDTREKANSHITDTFDSYKVPWVNETLKYGDYSFFIPANEELGIPRDLYFTEKCVVERKNSLEELCTNLTKERDRLEKEFALAPRQKVLLIENAKYSDVVDGNYKSQYNKRAFLGSIHSFWFKYNIPTFFMEDPKYSSLFIKKYFDYYLHNYLR